MYKYQNTSNEVQTVVVEGIVTPRTVAPGESVLSSVPIENANFKYMGAEQTEQAQITATQVVQDNAVTQVISNENQKEDQ